MVCDLTGIREPVSVGQVLKLVHVFMLRLADMRAHDLRHTFASRLVQRGAGLTQVKELMGHATIAMVQRYAHLSTKDLHAAISVLD